MDPEGGMAFRGGMLGVFVAMIVILVLIPLVPQLLEARLLLVGGLDDRAHAVVGLLALDAERLEVELGEANVLEHLLRQHGAEQPGERPDQSTLMPFSAIISWRALSM